MAKLEYADEVSSAKENAQNELLNIREETEQVILAARENAKKEKNNAYQKQQVVITGNHVFGTDVHEGDD